MALRISYDMHNVDWHAVDEVFRLAPLGRRDPETFQQACARSAVVVFAYDDDTLIGVGRALSDGAYYAAIYDVAVLPAFQGHGVGTRIVLALLEKLPVDTITLFAVPVVFRTARGKSFTVLREGERIDGKEHEDIIFAQRGNNRPFIKLKAHGDGLSVEPCAQGADPRIDRFGAVLEDHKLSSLSAGGLYTDIVFGIRPVEANESGKFLCRPTLHVSPPRMC